MLLLLLVGYTPTSGAFYTTNDVGKDGKKCLEVLKSCLEDVTVIWTAIIFYFRVEIDFRPIIILTNIQIDSSDQFYSVKFG